MEWIEGNITTSREALEAVGEILSVAGISGFQIEDDEEMKEFLRDNPQSWDYVDEELFNKESLAPRIKFHVPLNDSGRMILTQIKSSLAILKENDFGLDTGSFELTIDNVKDDWLENWKKYYKPFHIGDRIVIRPVWEEYLKKQDELVFTINPGHVFGTGLHQSTKLCIEALEKIIKPGQRVLDIGCGSGILGIISMMLGAKSAMLIDIDPAAADTVNENAKLNGINDNFIVLTGNILNDKKILNTISKFKYDVVISNIVADVVISLAPIVKTLIAQNGIYLSSGIIDERFCDVLPVLEQNGFSDILTKNLEGWVGVTCVFS